MAAATPTRSEFVSLGNKRAVVGVFTSIADTNTWNPGMSFIDAVIIGNGAKTTTYGHTLDTAKRVITFDLSASLASCEVTVIGV
jgi:hypothetical protein